MNALLNKLSPSATDLIRADHTRVLGTFHRYSLDASPARKQALVETACLLLEVHAQIEEEIFYPAVAAIAPTLVEKSVPEHEEIRRRIELLRRMDPRIEEYDLAFMELMRNVQYHVADEETIMLPAAERVLGERLGELGARMNRRRMQLSAPRAGQLVGNTVRAMPKSAMLVAAGAVAAGAFLLLRKPPSRLTRLRLR